MDQLSESLRKLWSRQRQYNSIIRLSEKIPENGQTERDHWTEKYTVGLVSEINELLDAVNWKRHRKSRKASPYREDLALALADMTKYVICLWELWGFSEEDMVEYSNQKSEVLEIQWNMEQSSPPMGRNIIISDIDGTLADWRSSFITWLEELKHIEVPRKDGYSTLLMDHELNMIYPEYYILKDEFEQSGGYLNLLPYKDSVDLLKSAISYGAYSVVYTARPVKQHQRIWRDTWYWLTGQGIIPDQLIIGHEPRILAADRLRKHNRVVMLEDDPGLIIRAANLGIKVYARRTKYNEGIAHENVDILPDFSSVTPEELFNGI